jgi:hypothetical protein
LVVLSPNSSTIPEALVGSTVMKSPTLYCPSKSMKNPAMMSRREFCAPKPAIAARIAAPPMLGSRLSRKMLR